MKLPATRHLRVLLFDFDHTLADLGRWVDWQSARDAVADLYGRAGIDMAAVKRQRGGFSVFDALDEALAARASRAVADEVKARAFAILEAHERAGAERTSLLPGAERVLAAAEAGGLGLGIVSANAESAIWAALGRLGVEARFGAVVGRTTARPLKPEPDMHHEALRLLGCPAEAALAVGDSPSDMEAATSAGTLAVGVVGGEGRAEQLFTAGACYVLADLTALPSLLALWAGAAE